MKIEEAMKSGEHFSPSNPYKKYWVVGSYLFVKEGKLWCHHPNKVDRETTFIIRWLDWDWGFKEEVKVTVEPADYFAVVDNLNALTKRVDELEKRVYEIR